jgi:hypothetical protein
MDHRQNRLRSPTAEPDRQFDFIGKSRCRFAAGVAIADRELNFPLQPR